MAAKINLKDIKPKGDIKETAFFNNINVDPQIIEIESKNKSETNCLDNFICRPVKFLKCDYLLEKNNYYFYD